MSDILFSLGSSFLDVLPPHGKALGWRGWYFSKFLRSSKENLKVSRGVTIYNLDRVSVGKNVYIGLNTYIGGGEVILDDEVMIGPFCSIVAGDHTMKEGSYRYGKYDFGVIEIGKGSWLGSNCVITNNVKIGKGCLIAAGSVVTKDIEDYSVVGGVPARVIKKVEIDA